MPAPKPLSRKQVEDAIRNTKSGHAAARYLRVSYDTWTKWAKQYKDEETGKTLHELHSNQAGKGIPKFIKHSPKKMSLIDIIEGRVSAASFNPEKIKYRLIQEGYLAQECNNCGFCEHRVLDYKVPLLLHFKDKNTNNYLLSNIELLCYNCYFLFIGDVFNDKDIEQLETGRSINKTSKAVDFEVSDYMKKRFIELGLEEESNDGSELISRL